VGAAELIQLGVGVVALKVIMIGDILIFKVVIWGGTPIMVIGYIIKWFKDYSNSVNGKVKRYQSKYLPRFILSNISIGSFGSIFVLVQRKGWLIEDQYININVILFLFMLVIALLIIIESEWFARLIDSVCGGAEDLINIFVNVNDKDEVKDNKSKGANVSHLRQRSGGGGHLGGGRGEEKSNRNRGDYNLGLKRRSGDRSHFSTTTINKWEGGEGNIKGLFGYKTVDFLANFNNVEDDEEVLISRIQEYLLGLERGKIYAVLPVIKWDEVENRTLSTALKISRGTDHILLAERVL